MKKIKAELTAMQWQYVLINLADFANRETNTKFVRDNAKELLQDLTTQVTEHSNFTYSAIEEEVRKRKSLSSKDL